ncbi:trypsin CFT-1 [Plodia interpunctella]|uniref:Trypsin n=1 Tax=Plodia interpunctella TaxID=58824 RepID=O62598_PLOIN|nr:trypsin CFT-1-like [Plodia interpunctella]AAC36247.1 trypsin [Plodia interpunctella]AAC36248.1 trypsin [Plodia interpunctella]
MRTLIVLALVAAAFAAEVPSDPYPNAQRIVGGTVTDISQWPEMAALLFSWGTTGHRQSCGGTILNQRSILSAAHCFVGHATARWQVRLGSTNANSGGSVFTTQQLINHPQYNSPARYDNDVAILRVVGTINYGNNIRAGSIAGANYNLGDNQVVWATGWGTTSAGGSLSEQLRQVQIWAVNQNTCRTRYASAGWTITDNMLCSGWLDVGGRDQCQGDSGGPLFHNRIVVGVCSWGLGCADSFYPGVNARVSRYTAWIQANA